MEFFSEHWGSMFSVLGVAISVIGLFVKLAARPRNTVGEWSGV